MPNRLGRDFILAEFWTNCLKNEIILKRLKTFINSMLTTAHLLFGAAIGKAINNPLLTVVLAFFTHYILDAIPHYSPKPLENFRKYGFAKSSKFELLLKSVEPSVGIILTFILIFQFNSAKALPMVLGSLFGWLPDLLVLLDWKFGISRPKPIAEFEKKFHHHISFLVGLPAYLLVSGASLVYLLLK